MTSRSSNFPVSEDFHSFTVSDDINFMEGMYFTPRFRLQKRVVLWFYNGSKTFIYVKVIYGSYQSGQYFTINV